MNGRALRCFATLLTLARVRSVSLYQNGDDLSDPVPPWNNTVHMSVILPSNSSYLFSLSRVRPAIELAINRVSQEFGWQFAVHYRDSGCQSPLATMHAVTDYSRTGVHLFVGPACDYAAASVARLLKFWRVPMVTSGALAYDFWDKHGENSEYFLMTRAGLSFSGVCEGFLGLFRRFGWRRMLIFYESEGRAASHGEDYCFLWAKAMAEVLRNASADGRYEFDGVRIVKKTPLDVQLAKAVSTRYSSKLKVPIRA
ncbi:atrial natriuretic peptide receptor 3-like [Ornithodoros turicata]|uniref:atrial natriuretic peptide receptor 3-like n=1 Tax=Ornithodoros turicata TaxID=34597 RepID=UPI003139C80A